MADKPIKSRFNFDQVEEKAGRRPKFWEALLIFSLVIADLFILNLVFHVDLRICVFIGLCITIVGALALGYNTHAISKMIVNGVSAGTIAILFNLCIGLIIAAWSASGVMPYIIYGGLAWFSPWIVPFLALLMCSIMSLIIGSSWTTAGTVGLAFFGIGTTMGLPAALMAGAIISGSAFGDKLSPLSESTVFAAAVARVPIMAHVKSMLYTSVPSLLLCFIIYGILGFQYGGMAVDAAGITEIRSVLNNYFVLSPFLLIVPVLLIVMLLKKVDALVCLISAVIMGVIVAITVQGVSLSEMSVALMSGVPADTGSTIVDSFIKKGGLNGTFGTIAIMLLGFSMGGILSESKCMEVLVHQFSGLVKNSKAVICSSVLMTGMINLSGVSYIGALLTANVFRDVYDELGIDRSVLSRSLEDAGTLLGPYIPWFTSTVFYMGTLGVTYVQVASYYYLGALDCLVAFFCAFTGWGVFYNDGVRAWGKNKPCKWGCKYNPTLDITDNLTA